MNTTDIVRNTPQVLVGLGTTWCPDTPENWAAFEQLKARVIASAAGQTPWQRQLASEAKRIRQWRAFLPGRAQF